MKVDEQACKLLTIVTNMGCPIASYHKAYICNSSALWNIMTDGDSRIDSKLNIVINMDDFLLYGRSKTEQNKKFGKCMTFAAEKNLKLKPNKNIIGTEVEVLTVEKVKNKELIFITLKGKIIKAFEELRKLTCMRDCQVFAGRISSGTPGWPWRSH